MKRKFSFTHSHKSHTLTYFFSKHRENQQKKTLFLFFLIKKKRRNEARNMCEFDAYRCLTEIPSFTWYVPTESHYSGLLSSFVRLSGILKNWKWFSIVLKEWLLIKRFWHSFRNNCIRSIFPQRVKTDNIIFIIEWLHSTPLNRSFLCGNSSRNA